MSVISPDKKTAQGDACCAGCAGLLSDATPGRGERILAAALFVLMAVGRVYYILKARIDSDEPQHLHVAWGWAHGLVQYRDFFDNHVPLFHLLSAPLVGLLGERPDIIVLMRLVMIPLSVATLWAFWRLLRNLLGSRPALWGTLLLGFLPNYFLCSLEYRTDVLWVMFQMLALLAFLGGKMSGRRALGGGLLLGLALCSSLKTVLMLGSLGGSLLLLPLFSADFRREFAWRRAALLAGAALAGFCLAPMALLIMIKALGAWPSFVYCAIQHNLVTDNGHTVHGLNPRKLVALELLVGAMIWRLARRPIAARLRVTALLLLVGVYYLILRALWPVVEIQTMMSFFPLGVMSVLLLPCAWPALGAWMGWAGPAPRRPGGWALLVIMLGLELALLVPFPKYAKENHEKLGKLIARFVDDSRNPRFPRQAHSFAVQPSDPADQDMLPPSDLHAFLTDLLRLTDPADTVLDAKGETIFRRRAYYYVLEKFTAERLRNGLMPDEIAASCVKARTCVVVNGRGRFPGEARRFMSQNYVSVGRFSVAGQNLTPPPGKPAAPIPFQLAIAARYDLLTPTGEARGRLDGEPYKGPKFLAAGAHVFGAERPGGALILIWAQAVERGFSPFEVSVP